MKKYICIHGHFYQPPRENPWLEAIEYQGSAHPFHDWNERIAAECYTPNSRARIEDGEGWLLKTVNNYARMSFNMGPTLLSWMQEFAPDTYASILEADRESSARFGGHGSAVAQCYSHMIMPLANRRDKQTQIIWGIRDFEHRFGRKPEGMWLAETAVDNETLDLMATYGIRYTILEPHQCARTRPIDGKNWREANGGQDLTMSYEAHLPSGRRIGLFFYNHEVSRAVAFEHLLNRGEHLANRLTGAIPSGRTRHPPLVHIATDGESYGHHHRYGEMALAWALESIDKGHQADLINYGQYLELYPPTHEAEIKENTAWSCVHGVGRWERACGCNSGGHPGWNQEWRTPLREALNWLRDQAAEIFEQKMRGLLRDPWVARNDYISVLLDRSPENLERFFARHTHRRPTSSERTRAMQGLEMQRHAMLMFTSCGWFFDELTGIETNQIVQYAARVIELVLTLGGPDLEPGFLERYSRARSNIPEHGDGQRIWNRFIKPARFDLHRVASWYAMGLLFGETPDRLYSYEATIEDLHKLEAGNARMVIGRIAIRSRLTFESERLTVGAIHLGQHNMFSGVRPVGSDAAYADLVLESRECIARGDLTAAMQLLDEAFPGTSYSLRTMFKDLQRSILDRVMGQTLSEAGQAYRRLYETNEPLMRYVADLGMRQMPALHTAARYAILADLESSLADEEELDIARIEQLLLEAGMHYINLDEPSFRDSLNTHIKTALDHLEEDPSNVEYLQEFEDTLDLVLRIPIGLELRGAQERFHILMSRMIALCDTDASALGSEECVVRLRWLRSIADRLKIRFPEA